MFKILFLLLLSCSFSAFAAEIIYYPQPESDSDPRTEYPVQLLKLALKKSGSPYELLPSPTKMQQGRAIKELEIDRGLINIVWSATSIERERQTLAIRIPIYKGLIGWRLFLVRKQNVDLFKDVRNIDDMRHLVVGQGHDWPDVQILGANGISVMGSPNYESLFQMLQRGRFDYFSRSVVEIWDEAQLHAEKDLVVANHIAFHYPLAFYFFVSKKNPKLAMAVTKGLEMAIADGSFDVLFHHYLDPVLKRSNLKGRTVIELQNPLMPAETPLQAKGLWYEAK